MHTFPINELPWLGGTPDINGRRTVSTPLIPYLVEHFAWPLMFFFVWRVICRPFSSSNLLSSRKIAKVERSMPVVQAVGPVEVAQIAGEAGFIGGVAGVMVGITLIVSLCEIIYFDSHWRMSQLVLIIWMNQTCSWFSWFVKPESGVIHPLNKSWKSLLLQGLAFGFILLRVESLTEEGKI